MNLKKSTEAITNYILRSSANNIKVQRFALICESTSTPNQLQGIDLFGKMQQCESYKKPIIRCYNCQKFNHIAKHCRGQQCCHNCGQQHQKTQTSKKLPYCVNYKQQRHHHHVLTTKHKLLKHIN